MSNIKRVMIVDDAMFMRTMLGDILKKSGKYEIVAEATNGSEAIVRYKECHPDIVTMDITMPEMDGIAALKDIKNFDTKARIVMVSAMGQQGMVIDAIKSGAKDFIVKPFQGDRVLEALGRALE